MSGEIANRESTNKTTMRLRRLAMVVMASAVVGCASLAAGCSTPSKAPGASAHAHSFLSIFDHQVGRPSVKNGALIVRFSDHSFGSRCFDTLKCRVLYQNLYTTEDSEPSGPLTDAIRGNLSGSYILDERPSVARVSWMSKDGVSHDEDIDLGHIFRSKRVRYAPDLDVDDVALDVSQLPPDIILVVEDRSIYVYMKAHISLLHPVIPGNRYSDFRADLVVAYSHKF